MKPATWKRSWILAVMTLAGLLAGCGGGSSSVPSAPLPASGSVAVSVNPGSITMAPGATFLFVANTVVNWSVQEPTGGSVTNVGLYTAPATNGTFHVVATSRADPTRTATAVVTVSSVPTPGSIAISISPSSVTMAQGARWLFIPTGSVNSIIWRVQEPAGGSVTSSGFYTAPATAGTFHVVATSQASPTQTATATVTVVPATAGRFAATGSMATARVYHTATRLLDGRVLVAGGLHEGSGAFFGTYFTLSSAELFDPVTGTFSPTGAMNHPRQSHTATLLEDGKVLIAGGGDNGRLSTAEIYDPATGTFSMTGNLSVARSSHTATPLANGTVLIAGGYSGDDFQPALSAAEIYDPVTGTFSPTAQLQVARFSHSASLLPNGQVLLAGGFTNTNNGEVTFRAELYDPAAGMFFVTGNMAFPRGQFVTAVLSDGKVLIAGGHATTEVYDSAIGSFFLTGAMNAPRQESAGVTLLDGSVLVCGGWPYPGTFLAELFHPGSGTFVATGSMGVDRSGHTATLLTDGRVLLTGGWDNDSIILPWAELYTP